MNTRLLRLLRARRGLLRLLRERPISGTALSVLAHVLVVVLVLWLGIPLTTTVNTRRGEPLFVELPQVPEPAPRGNPAARERGPDAPAEPPRATPPAPPAPKPAPAVRPPAPPSPPRVASAPPAAKPEPARPARPAEPSRSPEPKAAPVPAPAPTPPSPPAPSQETQAAPSPPPAAGPAPSIPSPAIPPGPPAPPGPSVAAIPRDSGAGRGAAPDMRSALRRGGAGGTSNGRGGIEGEPIPLDSPDPKYSDYLDRIRRMIKEKWIYPCIPNSATRQCEYKSAQLEIEFGIAKDGRVPFVIVRQGSQHSLYDEYAVNAIKLASPFPPVPDEMSKKGIPILARFNYILESYSLTNMLR